jgi:hypothetical protein
MAGEPEKCRLNAMRCLRLAERARKPEVRERFTELAETWKRLAAESESDQAAANSLLDRGYGKPAQPISQTLTKIDPSTMSDAELAAIVRNGIQADDRPH